MIRIAVTLTAMLPLLLAACGEGEGLVGPAAIEEPATLVLLPVERVTTSGDDTTLEWVEGWLLISEASFDCNTLISHLDEGITSDLTDALKADRHLLITLRREVSLDWPGLYAGDTSATLALDDVDSNRLSTGAVYVDGEEILSEEGGYVLLIDWKDDDSSTGTLDLGVVHGSFDAEVCPVIQREKGA